MSANERENIDDPKEEELSHESCPEEVEETPASSEEVIDYKAKYLRLLAENENLVRRVRKEGRDSTRFALQKLILDLLIPLDQFEMALGHAENNPSEEVKNWAIGFKMISKQFQEWLSAQDVYRFNSLGQQFDPQLHEASEMVETEKEKEGTIMKELLRGYKMGETVLRPARVVVAQKPQKEKNAEANDAESKS